MFRVGREQIRAVTRLPVITRPLVPAANHQFVILSGWAGARPKTLARYAEMYEKLGHSSVMVGVDLTAVKNGEKGAALAKQQTFWDTSERAMYTEMMEEHMEPLWKEHPDLKETAPIVHTFSNNGIQTWFNLAEVFQPHKGVIFDSSPSCPPRWDVPGLIFRLNNPNAPLLVKLAVSLVSNSVYSLRNLLKLKKQGMLIPDDMMEMIPPLLGEAPSLYLAGKLDVLTPPDSIEVEVNRAIEYGLSKTEFHVLEGGHCTMLRDDGENYQRIIVNWIKSLDQ